jgi:RNA recognition motif-containing protein
VRVSGLSYDATKEDIEAHFNTFTKVKRVNLLTDRNTGNSKGLCFVKFYDEQGLDLAVANNRCEHMGRWLNIEKAQT